VQHCQQVGESEATVINSPFYPCTWWA